MRTAIALFCAATMTALAGASEDITETRKFRASDLGNGDAFGFAIDRSITRTVSGAPFDFLGGEDAGAVYVHNTSTGQQLYKLLPPDTEPGLRFGWSVAATGQNVIAGALYGDEGVAFSGSVYVFSLSTGDFRFELTPTDAANSDFFGQAIAASGSRLLVGAFGDDDAGERSGSAYVFDLGSGQQIRKLTASDAAAGDDFGEEVGLSGTLAVVGAPAVDTGVNLSTGAAYIFDITTGQQLHKLTSPDLDPLSVFGRAVAISGDLVVVGAPFADRVGTTSGAAYVFNAVTGELLHELSPSTHSGGDFFGWSVAISGNLIAVGAPEETIDGVITGAGFVFDAQSGQELYRLTPSDADQFDNVGADVAVLGTQAWVSATGDDTLGPNTGAAYIFDITPCFADVNDDNTVDLADLNIILGNFGSTTSNGDTNFDGVVDLADLNRVLSEFGTDCP